MTPALAELTGSMRDEVRSLSRRRGVFTVLLLLPVLYPLIVSAIYVQRDANERPALVIDEDNSALSRELFLHLDATSGIRVVGRPASLEQAFEELRLGHAELLVRIPSDFSRDLKRGQQGHVSVWGNAGNMYTWGLGAAGVSGAVLDLNRQLGTSFLARRGLGTRLAARRALPIFWDDRPLFHPTASYGDFVVAGILLIVIQQIVLMSLAYSVGWQREDEVLQHSRYPFLHLTGKSLVHLGFYFLGIAFIVFGVFPAFHWPVQSPLSTFALFAALAVTMVPPALLVASLVKDRFVAFQLLLFFSVPLFLMSGFSWPLSQMPVGVQAFAWCFPATPALQALRVLSMKSAELGAVLPSLRVMALQWAVWSLLAFFVVRRRAHHVAPLTVEPASAGGQS
jgi:ABC-2 type transport system permease protein